MARVTGADGDRELVVNTDLWGGLLLLVFGLGGLLAAGTSFEVWVFPRVCSWLLVGTALVLLAKAVLRPERRAVAERRGGLVTAAAFGAGFVAYYQTVVWVGFLATTTFFYAAAMALLRGRLSVRGAVQSLVIAAAVTVALYLVFKRVFLVPLPEGLLWVAAVP